MNRMPTTLKEHLIFTFLMVFFMCLVMINYNVILHNGFSVESIKKAVLMFPLTFVVAFICEWFIVGRVAMILVTKFIKEHDPIFKKILITALFFFFFMATLMSLYGALITDGYTSNLLTTWIKNISLNFPMAYLLQVAIAGPFIRFVFNKVCPVKV